MSLEAIKQISEAEEAAKKAKAEATVAAKKTIEQAGEAGKAAVENAKKKAEDELLELRKKANEKARAEATELARNTENRKAAMLVKANSKFDKAAALVIERIVMS
ncbi:MAG: hypothetical protein RRY47_01200 [Oscillospiraceae bacterium]